MMYIQHPPSLPQSEDPQSKLRINTSGTIRPTPHPQYQFDNRTSSTTPPTKQLDANHASASATAMSAWWPLTATLQHEIARLRRRKLEGGDLGRQCSPQWQIMGDRKRPRLKVARERLK